MFRKASSRKFLPQIVFGVAFGKILQLTEDDIPAFLIEPKILEIMGLEVGAPAASLHGDLFRHGQDACSQPKGTFAFSDPEDRDIQPIPGDVTEQPANNGVLFPGNQV